MYKLYSSLALDQHLSQQWQTQEHALKRRHHCVSSLHPRKVLVEFSFSGHHLLHFKLRPLPKQVRGFPTRKLNCVTTTTQTHRVWRKQGHLSLFIPQVYWVISLLIKSWGKTNMTNFLPNSGQHKVTSLKLKDYEISLNFQQTNLRIERKKTRQW